MGLNLETGYRIFGIKSKDEKIRISVIVSIATYTLCEDKYTNYYMD